MMTDCKLCSLEEYLKLIEHEEITYAQPHKPAIPGHVLMIPKQHVAIIEQIPDEEFGKMMVQANKVSMALFESLQAQGTNIIIQNGISAGQKDPHVCVHVIPRREEDGLNFLWVPKTLNEEEMSTIELRIKENLTVQLKPKEVEPPKPEKVTDDYLLKQLHRIP
ncbi:HIT family protein [Candidatus Woesearchaeota archaeon]|nr:HIT family protein [Candidatus Woesearchaeota archaeon]